MSLLFPRRRIRRRRDGSFAVDLPEGERELLVSLAGQLRQLLDEGDDPSLFRLFPSAYTDRQDLDEEYQRLMRSDLGERHRWALATLEETAHASDLDEQQLAGWMGAINEVRLVLGTRLGVTDDPADADDAAVDDPALAVYHYLSWLLEQVVDALAPD